MNSARILASIAAVSLALGTAACGGGAEEPAPEAAPEGPAGISVADGRLNLPAVDGNPGAAYFTIVNDGEDEAAIAAVDVAGAGRTELHETAELEGKMTMQELEGIPLPTGKVIALEPGRKHVMVFDLDAGLAVGGETEVTVTFANGDKMSFPAKILAAGDDGGIDHSGHDHGDDDHSDHGHSDHDHSDHDH